MSIIPTTSGQLTWSKEVTISDVDMGNEGGDGTSKAEEYIKDKNKVLEWGSGTSTIYFSKIVKQFVSVEHNRGWYDYVSSQIADNVEYYYVAPHDFKNDEELDKNVPDLLCRANDPVLVDGITRWNTRDGFDWHCGIDYIRKPLELEYRDYDVVIVDGRCRTMCAYIAKYLIKQGANNWNQALTMALKKKNKEMVVYLINHSHYLRHNSIVVHSLKTYNIEPLKLYYNKFSISKYKNSKIQIPVQYYNFELFKYLNYHKNGSFLNGMFLLTL